MNMFLANNKSFKSPPLNSLSGFSMDTRSHTLTQIAYFLMYDWNTLFTQDH